VLSVDAVALLFSFAIAEPSSVLLLSLVAVALCVPASPAVLVGFAHALVPMPSSVPRAMICSCLRVAIVLTPFAMSSCS
jgi:hypothetical protein